MVHRISWKRSGRGRIVVGKVEVRCGDSVKWNASRTEKPIALFFPDIRLFGKHQDVVLPGRTKTLRVLASARTDILTVYPYAIYYVEWGRFGEGSSPIIIVKPS